MFYADPAPIGRSRFYRLNQKPIAAPAMSGTNEADSDKSLHLLQRNIMLQNPVLVHATYPVY